jgi:predicted MFS family arabinose efflux permease
LGLGLATTTNTVYAAERGLGDGAIGLILSLNGVLLALFAIPVQSSVEGRGPYRLLGLAAALVGSSFLLLGFVPPIGAALTAHVVVFTLGEFLFGPIIPAAVAALAPPGARGAYQGAWSMAFAIGYGGALFGSGLVKDALGWRATWALAAALSAAGAVALVAARGWWKRVAAERAHAAGSSAVFG